jgi:hypothetical protein
MKSDALDQYLSFSRELTACEADLNGLVSAMCEHLVGEFNEGRGEIAARLKREEFDGHRLGFCPLSLAHITPKKAAGTHALIWRRAIYRKGQLARSVPIPKGKEGTLTYTEAALLKHAPAPFQELVLRIEAQAAWVRRLNRALVKVRLAQRTLAAVGEPPA